MSLGLDSNDNVYAGHRPIGGQKITKCTPSGTCDDEWSTGYDKITGIDFDVQGNLFACDSDDEKLYKVGSDGSKTEYDSYSCKDLAIVNGVIFAVTGSNSGNEELQVYATETVAGSGPVSYTHLTLPTKA